MPGYAPRLAPPINYDLGPEAVAPAQGTHGNAAVAEQIPRVAPAASRAGGLVEPEWSRDLGREAGVDSAVVGVARQQGLCSEAQTDASCREDLAETAGGRSLLQAGEAVRRQTTVRGPDLSDAPGLAPHRERVGGNDLQHLDVGDGGIHAHIIDMSAGDDTTTVNGPQVSLHAGQIQERDGYDDAVQYGVSGHASLASVAIGDDDTGVNLNTPHADFEASVGQRGLVLEAGASALDADGRARFENAGDTRAEYGLGAEGRFGVRVPIEDTDGDGVPEVGLGISAGIARMQVTTEAFGQAGNWIHDHLP